MDGALRRLSTGPLARLLRPARRIGPGRIIGILLLLDLLIVRWWDPAPVEALRNNAFDFYQLMLPRSAPASEVVIVDIDERSLRELGQWPWSRIVIADIVREIARGGGKVIGFDVLFPERDRTSPGEVAETFAGLDAGTRDALRRLPNNDDILADTIRQARVVLGQSGYRTAVMENDVAPAVQSGLAVIGADPNRHVVEFPNLLSNLPNLEAAASGRGLFSIKPEIDGVIRRVPLIAAAGGILIPSLPLDMIRVDRNAGAIVVRSGEHGINRVGIQDLDVPTDRKGRAWIHFAPHDPSLYISAVQVRNGEVPQDRLAGKFVLIGTSAVGLLDIKSTPIDPAMPGVEVHAQVIDSILSGAILNRPLYFTGLEFGAAMLLSLVLIALGPSMPAGLLFVLGAAVAGAILALAWLSFAWMKLLLDPTFPLATSFSVYAVLVATNYLRESSDRQRIRSAFSQYLSPALVEQLAHSPEKLVLGGERREMTVMFTDVRGFTALSEAYKDDPQGLTLLLNRLLTPLTNCVIEHHGTIDKYIGDGVMAFWNAPIGDPVHEANACAAALDMLDRLATLNAERADEARGARKVFVPLEIGIGINTGSCFVGNFGSDLHFNYSALGDTVNVSSRLESQSKLYGIPIIVGSRTARAVADRMAVLELDLLQVMGKTEPERIFTILGRSDLLSSPVFRELAELQAAMLHAYRNRNWARALEVNLACRERGRSFGLDNYYAGFVRRTLEMIDRPPSDEWVGVTVREKK